MIRVLIVAHIPIIREGIRALLRGEKDFHLTTLTSDSAALLEDVLAKRPDVALIDVEVLERGGWNLLDDLRRAVPAAAALVLSDTPGDLRIAHALALGAHGYLARDASAEQMVAAIRAAQQGFYVLHPVAATTLLAQSRRESLDEESEYENEPIAREQDLIEPLSPRELDVLRLMARGMANKQIAVVLFITEHTVKFHIRAILSKLGAANRTEAVTLALQKGLVSL